MELADFNTWRIGERYGVITVSIKLVELKSAALQWRSILTALIGSI